MTPVVEQLLIEQHKLLGRIAFPLDHLQSLVCTKPGKAGLKQRAIYNACDGTRSQNEITKQLKVDSGNLSRTIGRWIELGILSRIESGDRTLLLHVYPIPERDNENA